MFKEAKIRAQQKAKIQEAPVVIQEAPVIVAEAPVVVWEAPVQVEEAFTPDGEGLPDGSVRYKILCDGGINPSGVFWLKDVPPGAGTDVYLATQAERDDALRQLRELTGN